MTPQNEQQQNNNQIQSVGGKEAVRDQDKVMLILAYLGLLSLIPLLTVKDSDYVKFHARQGLTLLIFAFAVSVLGAIPVVGWLVGCLGWVSWLVLSVMGIVKAQQGERWKLPVLGDLAMKINL